MLELKQQLEVKFDQQLQDFSLDSDQIEDVIIESQEENDLIETSDSLAISIMKVLLVAVLVL